MFVAAANVFFGGKTRRSKLLTLAATAVTAEKKEVTSAQLVCHFFIEIQTTVWIRQNRKEKEKVAHGKAVC